MSRFKGNQNLLFFRFTILLIYLTITPVDANEHVNHVLQRLNSFRRRVVVDVQSALMDQHDTLYQQSKTAIDSGDRRNIAGCETQIRRLEEDAREKVQMLQNLLDDANGNLEEALQQLEKQQQNVEAEIATKVQLESDQWRAKYSRLLKEQSVKAASLEQMKNENAELKQEMELLRLKMHEVENESHHGQPTDVNEVKNKALENAWVGRQNAELELSELKSKQYEWMKELDNFRGNASATNSAKDKALENAWTVLQDTMDELAVIQRLADTQREEKEAEKLELRRSFENEINKWRRDYSKLLQYQSTIMTELHQIQSDNHVLREEMENSLGHSKTVDEIKSKALENAWVGRDNAQKELIFANQLIDAMRKQLDSLQSLADQREKEVGQIADAASSLAKLQKDFEAETYSKHTALVERNKELENIVRKLRADLDEKAIDYQASVNSRVLEAEDKWWKQLSSARNQRDKSILSTKKHEIENLNRDVEILSSEIVTLRSENQRLVTQLDERHSEIILLSSGIENFTRAHDDFKISAERQIDYLTRRVSDTEALLDQKEVELFGFQDRIETLSKECNAVLLEQTSKSDEACRKVLLDRENESQSQIAAASNAALAAIDAVQEDLRQAYEQLYRVTEQNKFMEAKLVSQDSQLKSCLLSEETIKHEKDASDNLHKVHLQQVVSEVDELKAILLEKNEDLALLQTTLGEKIDETELLIEKAAFESAAEWQRNLIQLHNDCQARCSKAETLDKTQETLRETVSALGASNLVNRELRESLDHCRLETGHLSDTSNRLSRLHDQCQSQAIESASQFKLSMDDIEESARKKVEAIATELRVCRDALNEAENLCNTSLSASKQECHNEVEAVKKLSEQEIMALTTAARIEHEKQLYVEAEITEKCDRKVSECRRDLDRLSVAAQGLSKFQIIVDERAAEVQHSVSAELENIKSELGNKDTQLKDLTRQLEIASVDAADQIRDLKQSCSQKLSWLENTNAVKLKSLEESRDSALHSLKLCSEEKNDSTAEISRLSSLVTNLSEENRILDSKCEQKENEIIEMNTQLSQKDELFKSLRAAAVRQNEEMERKCQIAIKGVEVAKDMEVQAERESCSEKFVEYSHSCTPLRNKSENYGIKAVAEYSMTQKLWSLFGHESEVFGQHHLEAAIEHKNIEWKRKFQDLEDKSRALLLQTEEAVRICYKYADERLKNTTVELGKNCQMRLDEQESRHDLLVKNINSDLAKEAQERQKVEIVLTKITEEIKQLEADKKHMNEIMTDIRTHHAELLRETDMLEAKLLEVETDWTQRKMDAEYWRGVYEQRSYLNVSHIQEDAILAIKEAQKLYESVLEKVKEFATPAIPFAIKLSHLVRTTAALLIGQLVQAYDRSQAAAPLIGRLLQVYDEHVKNHVTQLMDAGRARYDSVVAPLFQEISTRSEELLTEIHLAVNHLLERFAIQISRSCPPVLSLLDMLGDRTNLQLPRIGKDKFECLCSDAKGTALLIFKSMGIVFGVIFAFILRRFLMRFSLKVGRLLLWPIQVLGSMVLVAFLFLFRLPMKVLQLFPRSTREFEATQTDSGDEQSHKLVGEDKNGEQSNKLIEEGDGDEESQQLADEDYNGEQSYTLMEEGDGDEQSQKLMEEDEV